MTGRWRHTDTGEATWIPAFAGMTGAMAAYGRPGGDVIPVRSDCGIPVRGDDSIPVRSDGGISVWGDGGIPARTERVAHLSGGGQLVHNPCKKLPDDSCRGFIYLYLYGLPEEEDTTVGKSLGLIHASDDEEDVARGAAHGRGVGVGGTRQHRGSQEDTSGMG